jgi:hypothetical protein
MALLFGLLPFVLVTGALVLVALWTLRHLVWVILFGWIAFCLFAVAVCH